MGFKLEDHSAKSQANRSVRSVVIPVAKDNEGMLVEWQVELDSFYEEMKEFRSMSPDEIFRSLSAYSARMNYLRTKIVRSENRRWNNFRTKEIEPFIVECDRQFKIWSRNLSSMSMEWDMSKGFA